MTQSTASAADAPYWDALSKGQLAMQRCSQCRTWRWPAVYRCGDCGSWSLEWLDTPLEGELFSWVKTWQPFPGSETIGLPFITVLVALPAAGGRRLMGLYEGDESLLAEGAPLKGRVAATQVGDGQVPSLRWSPR